MVYDVANIALPVLPFADSDSDCPDEFARLTDLNGKVPIILCVGLGIHDASDKLSRAFQGLWRQGQKPDEFVSG